MIKNSWHTEKRKDPSKRNEKDATDQAMIGCDRLQIKRSPRLFLPGMWSGRCACSWMISIGYWGNAMTSDLTPMQKNVLDFTIAFQQEYHMAPIVL